MKKCSAKSHKKNAFVKMKLKYSNEQEEKRRKDSVSNVMLEKRRKGMSAKEGSRLNWKSARDSSNEKKSKSKESSKNRLDSRK